MVTPDFDAIKKKLSGVFSTMRVMVVDDMPMNLDSYRLILQGLGVQRSNIFSATNGLKAVTSMVSTKPDLILSDWNMPVMDGLEFFRSIKGNDRLSSIPFLLLTSKNSKDEVMKALKVGIKNYIIKSNDTEPFKDKIKSMLVAG